MPHYFDFSTANFVVHRLNVNMVLYVFHVMAFNIYYPIVELFSWRVLAINHEWKKYLLIGL